jgi:rubrerythrin
MSSQSDHPKQSPTDLIRGLMREEMNAIEAYRRQASYSGDPMLHSLFQKLAEIRLQCYTELESDIREMKSQSEVTGQINAMLGEGYHA